MEREGTKKEGVSACGKRRFQTKFSDSCTYLRHTRGVSEWIREREGGVVLLYVLLFHSTLNDGALSVFHDKSKRSIVPAKSTRRESNPELRIDISLPAIMRQALSRPSNANLSQPSSLSSDLDWSTILYHINCASLYTCFSLFRERHYDSGLGTRSKDGS